MQNRTLCILALAAAAGGCATTERVWVKDGATDRDFYMDRGGCQAQSFGPGNVTLLQASLIFSGCMQGKGWWQEDRQIQRQR